MKEEDENLEINSGVEFPGDSLEPILGAATTVSDETLSEAMLVVEVADGVSPFAFRFIRNQRVIIGKCEYCTNARVLKVECKCKKVRYCSDHCLEKDKYWH